MKRKTILLVLTFLFSSKIFSQNQPLKAIPVNIDSKIINIISDSLRKKNIDSIFIYITTDKNNDYTYLIWTKKGIGKIIRISDNSISKPVALKLSFLRKTDWKLLAITEQENKLKMIPPLSHKKDCEIFIFDTKKFKYLIESGNSSGYVLDKTKDVSRSQFMIQLKQEMDVANLHWEEQKKYDRFAE